MIGLEEIRLAHRRIAASIPVSPCPRSEAFSEMTGHEVFLKLENRQRTGSYKERGALNRILTLSPEERRRGLVAASVGNHAQGVAYHAGRLGLLRKSSPRSPPLRPPPEPFRVTNGSSRLSFFLANGRPVEVVS